jgi:hypothetical protein
VREDDTRNLSIFYVKASQLTNFKSPSTKSAEMDVEHVGKLAVFFTRRVFINLPLTLVTGS